MYPLKKYFTEGLIQLTIMLSLLRMDPDTYLMGGPGQQHHHHHHLHDLLLVQGSAHTRPGWDATPGFLGPGLGLGGPGPALHPKNPDAAVLDGFWDMRRLLDEVRSLDRIRAGTTDIAAWLVHSNGGASGSPTSSAGVETEAGGGGGVGGGGGGDVEVVGQGQPGGGGGVVVVETRTTGQEEARALEERPLAAGAEAMPVGGSELTKEDLDLIEVLWRQDVDLGAERVAFDSLHRQRQAKEERLPGAGGGVDGTHAEAVDGETGEVVEGGTSDERLVQPATLPSETFSLDECLQLLEANFPFGEGSEVAVPPQQQQQQQLPPPRVDLALPTMTVAGVADRAAPPRSTALDRHLQELLSLPEFEALAATNDSFPDAYDSALLPELAGDAGPRGSLLLSSLNASSCPITRDVSLHDAAATSGVAARDEAALLLAAAAAAAATRRRDASSRAANPVARGPFSSPPSSPSSSFFFSSGFEALDPCHSRNFFRLDSSDVADVMDMELGAPLGAPLAPRLSSDLSDEALTGLLDPAFLDELSLMDLTDEEGMDIVGPAAPPAVGSCSSFSSSSPSSSSSSSSSAFSSSSSSPTGGVVAVPTPPRSNSLLSACDGISSFFGVPTMSREQSGADAGQQQQQQLQLQQQQQQGEAGEMLGATQRTSLCAELDSDSGLSLGSSPRASSPGSSITAGDEEDDEEEEEEEGAVGYSDGETMDVDSSSDDDEDDDDEEEEEEGAVGGYQPEYRKFCRMDFRNPDSFRATPSLDHVQHNHTYNLQAGVTPAQQQQQQGKPSSAPSPVSASSKDRPSTRLSRDERRARAMKIPFSTEKIINLPVEDFNALLGGHRLSEPQLALVRDIRRRGKNKVAAQNCRKRKLDTLLTLEGELAALRRRKDELLREKLESGRALRGLRLKLGELHAEVLASLRDGRGAGRRPLRPAELLLLQRVSEAGAAGAAGDDGGGAEAAGATAVASRDRAASGQRRAGSGKKGKKQEKKE
uniref:Endoplasmic reticulum membrane sensor NFE2L1-like isoform X2 n=1 Tax=Petromyzon marinus TaxID=7757 RepID=A0AAJ7TP58_PETMA|nr:endoplasmic reticulum membrane sensor NFE2L1-like isoform X2 [Petromyzon marinus]